MNLDRTIKCAYCNKPIPPPEDFYACSFGTSSNARLPMTSIVGVHWDCTYKIIDGWIRERISRARKK